METANEKETNRIARIHKGDDIEITFGEGCTGHNVVMGRINFIDDRITQN